MSRSILQSFNLVGQVIREEIEKAEFLTDGWKDGRTDGQPTHFIRSPRGDDLKYVNFSDLFGNTDGMDTNSGREGTCGTGHQLCYYQ